MLRAVPNQGFSFKAQTTAMRCHRRHNAAHEVNSVPIPYLSSSSLSTHAFRVLESRRKILAEIGAETDVTFVRGLGNLGDELIWAGTRSLLSGLDHREIGVEKIAEHRGRLAVLTGGGAWCKPYHEIMPHTLRVAEENFERVIVLPSSFDVSVPSVRAALRGTKAWVFAREQISYDQIKDLCRAALAFDCAFYFPMKAVSQGEGILNAFRCDGESIGTFRLPADNVDISVTCSSLEVWLHTIATHAVVRTDRAHVMIAAALMGKRVEFFPSSYHKLPAIADYCLRDFDVSSLSNSGRSRSLHRGLLSTLFEASAWCGRAIRRSRPVGSSLPPAPEGPVRSS